MCYSISKLKFAPIVMALVLSACQQDEEEEKIVYSDDIYELKEYVIPRMPTVVRGGWGIDFYHEGNQTHDSIYFNVDKLPAYHPNNPVASDAVVTKVNEADGTLVPFNYDLLFYNEMGYSQSASGDYTSKGNPVIFMYTDPSKPANSTKAVIAGHGLEFFNSFTYASITKELTDKLTADPLVDLAAHRVTIDDDPAVEGPITLEDDIYPFYATLVIGNKFRPGYYKDAEGNVLLPTGNNEDEADYQPVFLILTREGLYAKFMVTDFQGTGQLTQYLTLQWQALKAP